MWFNIKLITAIGETSDGSAVIYSVGSDARCVHETPQVVMEKMALALQNRQIKPILVSVLMKPLAIQQITLHIHGV